jgi:exosome complex component RRP45
MSASTTYTALKDDTADRSLSYNERIFLHSCATGTALAHQKGGTKNKGDAIKNSKNAETTGSILRTDGRHAGESRPIRLSFGRAHNMSECTVQLGANTRVSSSVSCHLIPPPHSDRPNDGSITFAVDLSPMSAMGFDYSQPASTMVGGDGSGSGGGMGQSQIESQKLLTNRILRILERTLLNGGAIDAEALCVQSGKWVWRLHIDVTVLDHGGNLVDACVLSAVAAMRHFRKPEVQINEDTVSVTTTAGSGNSSGGGSGNDIIPSGPNVLHSDEREPTPLPLHHTPLTVTFALYADPTGATTTVSALIDPSQREELVMNGNVTFSFNKYGEMCSLDFAGGCELKPRQLITCAKLGKMKCVELCNMLESSLVEADQKSIEERLARLKVGAMSLGDIKNVPVPMPLPDVSTDVPFVERTDYDRYADMMEIDQDDLADIGSKEAKAAAIAAAEEESYRIQALDFASGHVAAKVKEGGRGGSGGGSGGTAAQGSTMKNGPMFGGSLMDAMLKSAEKISNDTMNNQDQSQEQEYGRTKVTASNHTEAADLEIAQLVAQETAKDDKKQTKSQSNSKTTSMIFDSDEEEETTTLHGEFIFKSVVEAEKEEPKPKKQKSSKTKSSSSSSKMDIDGDDDDVDLTMAIKKKSKKKTKKSKSKK